MLLQTLIAALVSFALVYPFWLYFFALRGLRRFPAPSFIAALSPLWRIYHNFRMNQFAEIHKAHDRLGTHVRIAPNHISITAPDAVDEIYGHGANCLKDNWYDGGAGQVRTMADTRSKEEHQSKRKRMAHIFSQKSIAQLEPLIAERVDCLFQQVLNAAQSSSSINIRRYVNYFTIDVITAIMFGQPARTLEQGNDNVRAETIDGKTYTAPMIQSLHDSMRMTVPVGYMPALHSIRGFIFRIHPLSSSAKRFEDIVRSFVNQGLSTFTNLEAGEKPPTHFLSQVEHDKIGQRRNLPFGEILAECSGMINAGSDTTSTALTNCIWLLSQPRHQELLSRLREEVAPVFTAAKDTHVPSFDSLAGLPFLRACIDETLRLRPSSAFGLPREVPAGGKMIAGQFVPGGTSVSVPTYSILHDKAIFREPEKFRPQRWTDTESSDSLALMKKYHIPFSTGPRACIGRNVSYFEMTLVVAVLVHYFDFHFVDPTAVDHYRVLERVNANPDELFLLPKLRN
ncbi:hypothetical protein LTR99_010751 [Exophiala xenobiotica]|uniref:Cytochrome P450 n=1 Tax=Vermiconidia calcicola TaxID=1690605 RepID=A0AAV9PQD7_9PEZI|nr:hypothetical protein H2202_010099 [Exophiala xenobiotica]KAK5527778.1 hypothetical protein LTR25_010909 [Vermiconidia calcicola]KAK5538156.1 hypothetical protein LTR23_007120 [Chaetothyriales sp. CCFEE 6169]KAK5194801.1 hypothetical protein LTR92_004930 [Exophiala xenobiotica]KAK5216162.1 hypothetical protein LTR72_010901 [Exophiala xenobiotica]